jgi:hypothetical protein
MSWWERLVCRVFVTTWVYGVVREGGVSNSFGESGVWLVSSERSS